MMMMKMGTMITIIIIIIIYSNVFMFLWLVDGRLLPTCLVTIITLLTVGQRHGDTMGSRARVSESRLLGTVLSWKGRFGWIRADKRINHQESVAASSVAVRIGRY
eukprot:s4300_g7.t1